MLEQLDLRETLVPVVLQAQMDSPALLDFKDLQELLDRTDFLDPVAHQDRVER